MNMYAYALFVEVSVLLRVHWQKVTFFMIMLFQRQCVHFPCFFIVGAVLFRIAFCSLHCCYVCAQYLEVFSIACRR